MCNFWLPGGNAVKRQRVYNPEFRSAVTVNLAVQQPTSPVSPQHLHVQLQHALIENTLLKERISSLEKKLAASKEKVFTKGKPFSSLSPSRKRHWKQQIKDFLRCVSTTLPPDWLLEEVHVLCTLCTLCFSNVENVKKHKVVEHSC